MERKVGYLMMALFFILTSMMYGTRKLDDLDVYGSPRLSVVQGNIPQNLKWDPRQAGPIIKKYSELTREAAKDSPDMIIWPETAYPYLIADERSDAGEIGELAAEIGIPILAGVVAEKNGDYYNDALLFSEKGKAARKYEKLHLVPFGEYVPFGDRFSFIRDYIDKPIGDFREGKEYTLFSMTSFSSSDSPQGTITRRTSFYKFGVLICFEDIFPELSRAFVKRGANFLVNITNDAWFGRTSAPEQHLQASVFRAVENRVPVIRAANTGVSCFVDSTGEIFSRVEEGGEDLFVSGYATENVRIPTKGSVYSKYGDLFIYFCGFMLLLIIAMEVFLVKRGRFPSS
jgi:apolipoprotein N-acyltransferase